MQKNFLDQRFDMDVFYLTLKQMLMMFSLIAFGFFLRKKSILPDNSGTTMAKM